MSGFRVKFPVVVPVIDYGESEAEYYGEHVCNFLNFWSGRKTVKYEFLGYVGRHAQVIFYTEKSSKEFKKLYKAINKEIEEWEKLQEEEEQVCPTCGHIE